ncbi:axial filament protein [Iodidimonas gelatinilytica]|uniref:Axial filament protein n=1 Tax=Iodidimonas gelatinilytica TaxID=1236966 RepID=A0A5A7MR36_9PROT|nr:ribonuclease E/G [Iodidimonas gelatinilytica]GEQ97673.1 axial filament protein [Iodidimonas gelatinilytica]
MADLLIENSVSEYRVALVDEQKPYELSLMRGVAHWVESINMARVIRLAPEFDGAFLDLGGGVEGFMTRRHAPRERGAPVPARLDGGIHEGQSVPVQLMVPPSEQGKSWTVSADLHRKGRYITLIPSQAGLSFDDEGADKRAQARLSEALAPILKACGVRVHAPAFLVDDDVVLSEASRLLGQLRAIRAAGSGVRILLPGPDLLRRSLRDAPVGLGAIRCSDRATLAEAMSLTKTWPDLEPLLLCDMGDGALFERYGVEDALDEIAKGEIALPSGGRISFEDTRAAMVIDVDAGAACTGRSVARVARMVNLEAATAIALLLRRANIGGLVLVDFIDMAKHDDREAVLSALDAGFKADPAPIRRSKINHHGVLSITRKRTGLSVRDQMVAKSVSLPKLENSCMICCGAPNGRLLWTNGPGRCIWPPRRRWRRNCGRGSGLHCWPSAPPGP